LLLLQGVSEFVRCWRRAFGVSGGEVEGDPPRTDGEVTT